MARIGVFNPVDARWQPAPRSIYQTRYVQQNAQWIYLSRRQQEVEKKIQNN